jgi:hypothetical protein
MNRYSNNLSGKRWDGKEVYKTTIYPPVPLSDSDIYITASETESLDTLAFKYYNDSTLWWIIANINNIGKGRLSIEPGLQLRIPTDIISVLNTFKQLNQ